MIVNFKWQISYLFAFRWLEVVITVVVRVIHRGFILLSLCLHLHLFFHFMLSFYFIHLT